MKKSLSVLNYDFKILKSNTKFKETFKNKDDLKTLLKSICIIKETKHKKITLSLSKNKKYEGDIYFDNRNKKIYIFLIEDLAYKQPSPSICYLTKLPNRKEYYLKTTEIINNKTCSYFHVFLLNIDGFRVINNHLGHKTGDELIIKISKKISNFFKEKTDIFRMSGDSFCIIIEQNEKISDVAYKLINHICQNYTLENIDMFVTASIGISTYPIDGADADTLLKKSDIALYKSKSNGYNNFMFFESIMINSKNAYLTLGSSLLKSINENDFYLNYQPKIDSSSQKIIGAEALIRWEHPEMGKITPDRFISIAEDTGLIVPLGEWVIRKACSQIKAWGSNFPHRISINVSMKQIANINFITTVKSALDEFKINANRLELEITETVLMSNTIEILKNLNTLRKLGLKISIDDFGTGYSSLSYLKKLPIDIIKIDRSFIRDLDVDSDDQAIVKATIDMAKSLNLKVIAEGAENSSQVKLLSSYGCNLIQGFFYSKPLSPTELIKFKKTISSFNIISL